MTPFEEWVEALESERYQQTQSQLRCGDAFCCLGVACDLYDKAGGAGHWSTCADPNIFVFTAEDGADDEESYTLPDPVADWLGIERKQTFKACLPEALALLNDAGFSFKEIAKFIRNPVYPKVGDVAVNYSAAGEVEDLIIYNMGRGYWEVTMSAREPDKLFGRMKLKLQYDEVLGGWISLGEIS